MDKLQSLNDACKNISSGIRIRTVHGSDKNPARPGTVVYCMAATWLKEIANKLLGEGFCPETPAAIVERAGLTKESSRTTTLDELQNQKADSPAIVIIGDVVGLRAAGVSLNTA